MIWENYRFDGMHKKLMTSLAFFCLTKSEKCAIIIKLSDESPKAKDTKKIFKKSLKKVLTNEKKCDIIDKSL